ncbi:MAG: glycosyltransferase [Nitrospiraceae bacterium]|nr:MAG: glycosyltransferase [Nitrospiraceae bacterium]
MKMLREDEQPDNGLSRTSPSVSIIVNCLNGEQYLREALDSIFSQTFKDWEVIFWEDKDSTDKSGEIAKSYGGKLRHFKAKEKLPLYGARNQAITKAKGRYIAVLDCDDIWMPTKLEEQIPLFEADKEVGLVYSNCILFNGRGREKRFFDVVRPERGRVFEKLLFSNFINTQTVVIRRDVLDGIGLFDGRLHMSGDYDAYLRIGFKWKLDYVNKPLARYRVHSSSMTLTDGRRLLAREIGLTIKNLRVTVPEIDTRYADGIKFLARRKDIQTSLMSWEAGDRKSARHMIRQFIFDSIYCSILYFLMFFSYRIVFKPLHRLYQKNPVSDLD